MLHVTEFLLASQQESSRFQPFPFFEEGSNPNRLPLSIVNLSCHLCSTRDFYGSSIAVIIHSLDLLDCACDAQTDSLRHEISAINELFSIKNGGACLKSCK